MSTYIDDIYTNKAFHWLQFLKTNNLGFLRLEALNTPVNKVVQDDSQDVIDCYYNINDQIINTFGIDESFWGQKLKEQEIAILKLDYIICGDKRKRTEWRIKELQNQKPEDNKELKYELEREIEAISKTLGSGIINIKDYTIHQYIIAKNSLRNGK